MKRVVIGLALVLLPAFAFVSCAQQAGEESGEAMVEEMGQEMEMGMAVDMEALGEEIAGLNAAFNEAFENGDAAALAAMYAEDGIRMAPNQGLVRGREAIAEVYSGMFSTMSAVDLGSTTIDFGASGDLVYDIGTYAISFEMEGEAVVDQGKYLTLSRRAPDGSLKVVALIFNTDLPEE